MIFSIIIYFLLVKLDFRVVVFAESGKLENAEKILQKGLKQSKQQTQSTCDARFPHRYRFVTV